MLEAVTVSTPGFAPNKTKLTTPLALVRAFTARGLAPVAVNDTGWLLAEPWRRCRSQRLADDRSFANRISFSAQHACSLSDAQALRPSGSLSATIRLEGRIIDRSSLWRSAAPAAAARCALGRVKSVVVTFTRPGCNRPFTVANNCTHTALPTGLRSLVKLNDPDHSRRFTRVGPGNGPDWKARAISSPRRILYDSL